MTQRVTVIITGLICWLLLRFGFPLVLAELFDSFRLQTPKGKFQTDILLSLLTVEGLAAIIAGWFTAFIEKNCFFALFVVSLLATGILYAVQISDWGRYPFWYHAATLVIITPMMFLGSRIQR